MMMMDLDRDSRTESKMDNANVDPYDIYVYRHNIQRHNLSNAFTRHVEFFEKVFNYDIT